MPIPPATGTTDRDARSAPTAVVSVAGREEHDQRSRGLVGGAPADAVNDETPRGGGVSVRWAILGSNQ